MIASLFAFFEDKPEVDVSAHIGEATTVIFTAIILIFGFFLVRPELWRRMLFTRIDPRPAALMRIVFGIVVLWTFVDLIRDAKFLFTDEGMWLTKMARKNYGGKLTQMWDPEHGFEHWYDIFVVLWGKFTIFHMRSDPAFVYSMYAVMLTSLTLMILGVWTRFTTILSWFMVEQVYRYSPLFYTGGDTVVRVFMYLGMFCRWGEAYSLDNWWRTRREILRGATRIPALRLIPAWPQRLMMLQLAIIYCATGLLKSGVTWLNGTALYYSLCLDHFYRMPQQIQVATFMQWIGVLPVVTVVVRFWELAFPLVLVGVALNAYERERKAGTWPVAAAWRRMLSYLMIAGAWLCGAVIAGWGAYYYIPDQHVTFVAKEQLIPLVTLAASLVPVLLMGLYFGLRRWSPRGFHVLTHWVLGRRFWLVWGFLMHIGIDVGMNVGTFAEVMMAAYFAWPTGEEVDRSWRYLLSRPAAAGQAGRPIRKRKLIRWLLAPIDRLKYRLPGEVYTVHHNPDETSVRHAALLRCWDLGYRLEFVADRSVPSRRLVVSIEGEKVRHVGAHAGRALLKILPGLWWLRPVRHIPVLGTAAGALAVVMLRQRP